MPARRTTAAKQRAGQAPTRLQALLQPLFGGAGVVGWWASGPGRLGSFRRGNKRRPGGRGASPAAGTDGASRCLCLPGPARETSAVGRPLACRACTAPATPKPTGGGEHAEPHTSNPGYEPARLGCCEVETAWLSHMRCSEALSGRLRLVPSLGLGRQRETGPASGMGRHAWPGSDPGQHKFSGQAAGAGWRPGGDRVWGRQGRPWGFCDFVRKRFAGSGVLWPRPVLRAAGVGNARGAGWSGEERLRQARGLPPLTGWARHRPRKVVCQEGCGSAPGGCGVGTGAGGWSFG